MNSTLNYLTDERGERTAVVVPLPEFEKLMEDLEDLAGPPVELRHPVAVRRQVRQAARELDFPRRVLARHRPPAPREVSDGRR